MGSCLLTWGRPMSGRYDEVLRQGDRDEVGWEKVDFYGQTGHRSYEERQRNPGDWEAWTGQGPITVHKRENLATTDKGIALLRARLRNEIRALATGDALTRPEGSENQPIPTYGGDTVLRVAKSNDDDRALLQSIQEAVAQIYFSADHLVGEERAAFIRAEVSRKFPG